MASGRHQVAEVVEVASVSHLVTANEASLPIDWNALELGRMYIYRGSMCALEEISSNSFLSISIISDTFVPCCHLCPLVGLFVAGGACMTGDPPELGGDSSLLPYVVCLL